MPYHLETSLWLPSKPEDVFPFFGDAHNLEAITPPILRFEILTPRPIAMGVGTLLDYRIRLRGVPIRWRTRIAEWSPPFRFVDEQLKGPYRRWVHTHTFTPADGGTLVRDHVAYNHWGGPFVERWLVRPDLDAIFRFRNEKIRELLSPVVSQ